MNSRLTIFFAVLLQGVISTQSLRAEPLRAEPPAFPVGALLSLSGDCADVGELSRKGLELAVEEINEAGGIIGRKVNLIVEDSRETNSINAVTAYKNILLQPNLHFVVGPSCTPAGLALAPIVSKNDHVVMISPSIGLRQFNEAGENIFKFWPYDEDGPKLLAQYARDQGWKNAAVFSSQQAWEQAIGNFFVKEFERLGGKVIAKEEPLQSENDLRTPALKLIKSKPDVIVLTNYLQFDRAAKELQKQGYHGPKLSSLMTGEKIERAEGALEGTVVYGYEPPQRKFLERFTKKYGKEPWSIGADTAYDALMLVAQTINHAKTDDPILVRRQLLEVRNYAGASGVFSIDAHGGVQRSPILSQVRGNALVPLRVSH